MGYLLYLRLRLPDVNSRLRRNLGGAFVAALLLTAAACASSERPVLYPNAQLQSVGNETAQREVDQCLQLADNSGLSRSSNQVVKRGAEGGAVGAAAGTVGTAVSGGNIGTGAAAGAAAGATAGVIYGAFRNNANPTWRNYVQRCLHDRGYDVIGWQ
jgi:outer membrane lipoprotein SlyB